MHEARAIVVQLEGTEALVESTQGSGCGQCSSSGGCSSGKLTQMFCVSPRRFRVRNSVGAQVGDEVQVSVGDGVVLRSALILYGLPVLLLIVGGITGTYFAGDAAGRDAAAASGAFLGVLAGFVLARLLASRQQGSAAVLPVIVHCKKPEISK
jgi:sigma-E factor negative regulatory protein RseC